MQHIVNDKPPKNGNEHLKTWIPLLFFLAANIATIAFSYGQISQQVAALDIRTARIERLLDSMLSIRLRE